MCDRTAAGAAFTVHPAGRRPAGGVEPGRPPGAARRRARRTRTAPYRSRPRRHRAGAALTWRPPTRPACSDRATRSDEVWLPTLDYDGWRPSSGRERWAALAWAWLDTTRVPGLVGGRDERDRPLAALGPDLDRTQPAPRYAATCSGPGHPAARRRRRAEEVTARLRWHRPRRAGTLSHRLVGWTLREAELLGVTGRGALSGHGRALLAGDLAGAAAALAPLLPEPTDHVLLQADLTAVAPGPLDRGARPVAGADGRRRVHRRRDRVPLHRGSVRRALDAGRAAADLHALLAAHSRTPVPQPLTYLIDDVARRHGRIRVGAASAYLRCDDEALLAELLADRRAAGLRLRRLAPTVLAAAVPVDAVLETLRALGTRRPPSRSTATW